MPKIEYRFVDGTSHQVEVEDDFATAYQSLVDADVLIERKETRRHHSLFMFLDKGIDFIDKKINILGEVERRELNEKLHNAISKLLPSQQTLIYRVYFCEEKMTDIALEEGVDSSSIRHRLMRATKKLKKYLD